MLLPHKFVLDTKQYTCATGGFLRINKLAPNADQEEHRVAYPLVWRRREALEGVLRRARHSPIGVLSQDTKHTRGGRNQINEHPSAAAPRLFLVATCVH